MKKRAAQGVPILLYHDLATEAARADLAYFCVSPNHFRDLLVACKQFQFTSSTLDEPSNQGNLWNRNFVISFDDGFLNTLTNGAPTMRELGFSAIQYLVVDKIGGLNDWDIGQRRPQRIMDQTQVKDWLALGNKIGAHTLTHPRLTQISLAEAWRQIADSKKKLEDLFGRPIEHFSYPYGDHNEATVRMVEEAGYCTASTTIPGCMGGEEDRFRLPRFHVVEQKFAPSRFAYFVEDATNFYSKVRRSARAYLEKAKIRT